MICPRCHADVGLVAAALGVGIMYGPWGCHCGWSENTDYDVTAGPRLTPEGYQIDQWGGATPPQTRGSEIR